MHSSETQGSGPTELQQRMMIFSKAFQDLVHEIAKTAAERDHLLEQNHSLGQELAKAKIELKHDVATKTGAKKEAGSIERS